AELSPKQRSALARAIANPELVWVLLEKATGVNWIQAFEDVGWLDASAFPDATNPDSKGLISFPSWPISHYLARNSGEMLAPENRAVAERVYKFILDATDHAKEEQKHNYRVWWNFAQTMQGMPIDLVDQSQVWMFEYWLNDP